MFEFRIESGHIIIYFPPTKYREGHINVVDLDKPFKDEIEFFLRGKTYECSSHGEYQIFDPVNNNKVQKYGVGFTLPKEKSQEIWRKVKQYFYE